MKSFEVIGPRIVAFLNDPLMKTVRLIDPSARGARFVVCGTSGSGKTRAICLANSHLPEHEQIAESQDLLSERDPLKALGVVNDPDLEYEASLHIAFNVIYQNLAKELEFNGVKVFWLDGGSTGIYGNS
jgi:hypothetical protein